jgi:hypothetical protein
MERRYHLDSKDHCFMVESSASPAGLKLLKERRKQDARFKNCHIREVIQASPEKVPLHTVIERKHWRQQSQGEENA